MTDLDLVPLRVINILHRWLNHKHRSKATLTVSFDVAEASNRLVAALQREHAPGGSTSLVAGVPAYYTICNNARAKYDEIMVKRYYCMQSLNGSV